MEPATYIPTIRLLAASILAQETNGEYIGSRTHSQENKPQNRQWMMEYLNAADPRVDERIPAAEEMITYCNTKMIELLSGTLTNYWKAILEAISKEEIGTNSYSDWGLIASVPSAYMRAVDRDSAMEARERASQTSVHFGKPGDPYRGTVHIISQVFSIKFKTHFFTGVTEEGNLVNFPHSKPMAVDRLYKISGKVRKHGDSATTLLNYVKIEVDKDATDANI